MHAYTHPQTYVTRGCFRYKPPPYVRSKSGENPTRQCSRRRNKSGGVEVATSAAGASLRRRLPAPVGDLQQPKGCRSRGRAAHARGACAPLAPTNMVEWRRKLRQTRAGSAREWRSTRPAVPRRRRECWVHWGVALYRMPFTGVAHGRTAAPPAEIRPRSGRATPIFGRDSLSPAAVLAAGAIVEVPTRSSEWHRDPENRPHGQNRRRISGTLCKYEP